MKKELINESMANKVTLKTSDGSVVEFWDEIIKKHLSADIYMGIGKPFIIKFFKEFDPEKDLEKLKQIVEIFQSKDKDMQDLIAGWPSSIIEWNGKTGVVVPFRDEETLNNYLHI